MMAACDTFRSGAVEQLRTHARRLNIPIFEKGYEKDPAVVAKEAIQEAARNGSAVVLVDTAGRMQVLCNFHGSNHIFIFCPMQMWCLAR
ncbi:Signal recognition particle receptor subunit alpha [Thalictrum thalictroides]|uniref:Signal recognition particle receptor subunit alpha n=1 Tax=Thalictrum thalictroides TaxID=46969 RepID=A0A7J6WDK6_THATH|nr:Signal recognition particle receptor subunit alpha [Thalictrum thalictroides]